MRRGIALASSLTSAHLTYAHRRTIDFLIAEVPLGVSLIRCATFAAGMKCSIVALDLLFGKLRASLTALDRIDQVIAEEQKKVKQRPENRDTITPRRRAQKRECS